MQKIWTLTALLVVVGCATQTVTPQVPGVTPVAASGQAAAADQASGAGAATSTSATKKVAKAGTMSTAELVADAKRRGYTVTNQDGQELLCHDQLKIGSRLQKDTICMTPADYDELRRRTQEGLANTMRNMPPPQSH